MKPLQKPARLRPGDTVAAVSLSWGGAGDAELLWRYELGKQRIRELLGLTVVEMPHTLAGSEFLYRHPEARARDLMQAFSDSRIKGIFSCIGGDDSIRLLPFIDFDVIAVAQEELGPVQIARNGHGSDGDAWPGDFFFAGLDHIFHGRGQHVEIGAWAAAERTAADGKQSGQRQQGQQQRGGALFHITSFFL